MKKFINFILMAMIGPRRLIAVLDFPADIEDFIGYAKGIHDSMDANALFAALAAKLTALATKIADLDAAQTGLHTSPPTVTRAQRDIELLDVQNKLRELRGDVQALSDADVPNAENIITSAGMKVKKPGTRNVQDLVAKDGRVSGSVKLVAKGIIGKRHAHDWAMSQDGTNWTSVNPTLQANTEITGLVPGTSIDLRHRYVLRDGCTDWIEIFSFIVR
jgi:hypothetical protein